MKTLMVLVFGALLLAACTGPSVVVPTATPTTEEGEPTPTADVPTPTLTETTTPTPSHTPTATSTPSPTPLPVVVITTEDETRESLGDFLRTGFGSSEIQLSKAKPEELSDTPEPEGEAHYGFADLGAGNILAVMVDVTADEEAFLRRLSLGTLYVGKSTDGSLADAAARQLSSCCGEVVMTLSLQYKGEEAPLAVRLFANVHPQYQVQPTPTPLGGSGLTEEERRRLEEQQGSGRRISGYSVNASLSIMSLRVGRLPGGGTFLLENTLGTPRFDDPNAVRVLQDLDGSGFVAMEQLGEIQPSSQAILVGTEGAWSIHSISSSGRTVELLPKKKGIITGRATVFAESETIAGATVRVWPGEFETQTGEDGSFRMEAYEGALWKLLVTKEGYIPYVATSGERTSLEEIRLRVRAGEEISHTVELARMPEETMGSVVLTGSGSFYGALGMTFRDQALGDLSFQVNSIQRGSESVEIFACACQPGQRGLAEMGDQGSKSLENVSILPFGYSTEGFVRLQTGHVYVVKAREGFENHFVVFRVESMTTEGVRISYLFR